MRVCVCVCAVNVYLPATGLLSWSPVSVTYATRSFVLSLQSYGTRNQRLFFSARARPAADSAVGHKRTRPPGTPRESLQSLPIHLPVSHSDGRTDRQVAPAAAELLATAEFDLSEAAARTL